MLLKDPSHSRETNHLFVEILVVQRKPGWLYLMLMSKQNMGIKSCVADQTTFREIWDEKNWFTYYKRFSSTYRLYCSIGIVKTDSRLSFCGRNHSSQADHPAVVGFASVGCRYKLPKIDDSIKKIPIGKTCSSGMHRNPVIIPKSCREERSFAVVLSHTFSNISCNHDHFVELK